MGGGRGGGFAREPPEPPPPPPGSATVFWKLTGFICAQVGDIGILNIIPLRPEFFLLVDLQTLLL